MKKINYLSDLNEIFSKYFNRKISLNEKYSAKDIRGWDSLAQVGLVLMIEKKYKIKFSISQIEKLKNVGDMIDLLKKINEKKKSQL